MTAPAPVPLREAASVILLRRQASGDGFEVLLLRRRAGASFMAQAYVFPGGGTDEGEDARTAAARELFEEAGILLARDAERDNADTLEAPNQELLREKLLAGEPAGRVMASAGLAWWTEALVPWAHWITPSNETRGSTGKRYSARFFVIELPPGQDPSFDQKETVDLVWVTPAQAIARAAELLLPPPQVRTCWELSAYSTIEAVLDAGRARADEPHPIMPRVAPGPMLLLPWDPDYMVTGTGDAAPLTYTPSWATGPSRFVMEAGAWKHIAAPRSTTAG